MLHQLSMNFVIFVLTEQIPNTILFNLSHMMIHKELTFTIFEFTPINTAMLKNHQK